MTPGTVEIARFRDAEPLQHCCKVLDEAGVAYRVATDAPVFDLMTIGGGPQSTAFVIVATAEEVPARQALLEAARSEITDDVLEGHFFQGYSDADLLDVIEQPAEWSGENVAAAEKILSARQVSFTPAVYSPTPQHSGLEPLLSLGSDDPAAPPEPVLEGQKNAAPIMIAAGYVFGAGWGLYSFIIGWVLFHSLERLPDGRRRYVYTPSSRTHGAWLMVYSVFIFFMISAAVFIVKIRGTGWH